MEEKHQWISEDGTLFSLRLVLSEVFLTVPSSSRCFFVSPRLFVLRVMKWDIPSGRCEC